MLSSLASILAAAHHLQLPVKAVIQVLITHSVRVRFPGLLHLQECAAIPWELAQRDAVWRGTFWCWVLSKFYVSLLPALAKPPAVTIGADIGLLGECPLPSPFTMVY